MHAYLFAQYFFTGEVKDQHGDRLQNGSILVQSTGSSYKTGFHGEFGITSRKPDDTLILSFEGYEPYTTAISTTEFLAVTLKRLSFPVGSKKNYIKSVFTGLKTYGVASEAGHGSYSRLVENPFVHQSATVSFPGNINRASYNLIRRFLEMGYTVPPEAVQIEEMLNYFNDYYEDPEKENVFSCLSNLVSCPWNESHKLLYLNICARKVKVNTAPPGNLVFLIDASGSMDLPNKLPMVKSGIRLLVKNLRDIDTFSLVEFGGKVRVISEGIPGSDKGKITRAIEELAPDGPTPGEDGIKLAYEVAHRRFIPGGNNRVILVTDGDINEGASAEKELEYFIGQQSQSCISLNCIGVGMANHNNSELPILAQKGHGNFAYADEEQDAEKLLVSQLAQSLFPVADGVSITTDFNAGLVKEYRLIGFDNKKSSPEDTAFRLEGSKIGSGHSLLALFELVPKDDSTGIETVAEVKINYCLPGQNSVKIVTFNCPNNVIPFDKAGSSLKKAACIAMFGMKLRESAYVSRISWIDIEKMAKKNFNCNDFIDKEYQALVAKAKRIYKHNKGENE